jgi:DNA-binding transcriptional ArsR family regulator
VPTNASVVIEALGDPTRRAIFERLAQGSAAVGELAQVVPVTRSAVSQHLKILKGVGLVSDRAVGTRRVYTVDPEALAALREYFDAFWHQSLAAFARAAEHTKEEP